MTQEIQDARPIVRAMLRVQKDRRMNAFAKAFLCLLDVGALDERRADPGEARRALAKLQRRRTWEAP